jgi:molecular chaperone GrpE
MKDQENEVPETSDVRNELPETNSEEHGATDEKKEKAPGHKHKKDSKTEKLEQEVAQLNDKYLRLYSEFDNFRKRTLREKLELSKVAATDVIASILPVIDDLERAYAAIETTEEVHSATKDGLGLILNKLMNILSQQGMEPIKALGEDFNTDFHEAVTKIPAPTPDQKGKIVDVIEKGYMLGGKVIRFAKVVVGS